MSWRCSGLWGCRRSENHGEIVGKGDFAQTRGVCYPVAGRRVAKVRLKCSRPTPGDLRARAAPPPEGGGCGWSGALWPDGRVLYGPEEMLGDDALWVCQCLDTNLGEQWNTVRIVNHGGDERNFEHKAAVWWAQDSGYPLPTAFL